MDLKLIKVRGFNLLLILFISVLLILLIMTSMLFLSSSVNSDIPIPSIVAAALLLLFCVPICIILYFSNNDKLSKRLFLALSITLFVNTISGVVWYLLPSSFNWTFLNNMGMLLMIFSYIPITYALVVTYKEQNTNIHKIFKIFIFYIAIAFIILLIYYSLTNIKENNDLFTIIIYTCAIILDVIIVALTAILILINLPTQLRYLFSIVFGFYSFSFMGDSLNLLQYLTGYVSPIDSQYFYDIMFIFASGTLLIYSLSNIKITTVEEVNKKLQDTTLVVEDLIMQSPDAMSMCDVNGTIIKANNLFRDIFKITDGNSNIFKLSITENTWFEKLKKGETITLDYIYKNEETNNPRYLSLKIYPTFTSDKKISNYIFISEDITIRKNAEDALKNAYEELENRVIERTAELSQVNVILQKEIREHEIAEETIKNSLKEKDVLLKEIHHRVKNNMQIISSMLGLQSANVKDNNFNLMLKDSQGRIKSMALIHEKLYQSDNLASIDFAEYVNSLISYLRSSYIYDDRIKINTKVENISLNIDTAIPLGLIINELISNSYKHAFKNNLKGEINLEIYDNNDGSFLLTVGDNGGGLPENFDINTTKSLGLQLVNVLVEQLNGNLKITNNNGAKFEILFNVK